MVKEAFLTEGSGFPAFHSGRRDGNPIDSASLVWNVAANVFQTISPEYLALPRDVVLSFKAIPGRVVIAFFQKRCAGNTKRGIVCKFPEQKLDKVRLKSDVRINVTYHIVILPS